jgi:pyruvate-ferredoxin/flavodoxin oxidoreductase
MSGLRDIAIRWYRNVFGAPAATDIRDEGLKTVLDGNSAVALTEAGIAGHAVLGGSMPAAAADAVWLSEIGADNANLFGEALSAEVAEGPRGMVAAATGLALAGRRATAFLSGPDVAAVQDLLISAAGKHAPMVLHLVARAATAHGATPGSGHDTVHLCAESGFFMLFAMNTQQAIDFTIIARSVAERSLVPGIVVMDGEQTALAAQDVHLMSPAQVRKLIGSAGQQVESPTAAQKLLFGETRRQVPAWHDLDEPALTGALFAADSFALGALARGPYFDAFVQESLATAFEQFEAVTGRRHEAVSGYRLDDASTVLVAQGAAIESARLAADQLRQRHKVRVGVLGVHALRPFPAAAIVEALAGKQQVFILERADTPLAGEPPLTREIRAGLGRLGTGAAPPCRPVIYGVGGLPLRLADLTELCTRSHRSSSAALFLGLAFDDTSGDQPKRAVLLDTLRRAYPDIAESGIRAPTDAETTGQANALSIAIQQHAAGGEVTILGVTGALLQQLAGGRVRSRGDWIAWGDESLQDPGDDLTPDVTVDVSTGRIMLNAASRVFEISIGEDVQETLLGGLFGALIDAGLVDFKARQVIAARRRLLEGLGEERREQLLGAFQDALGQVTETSSRAVQAATSDSLEGIERRTPATVRHLARDDDHYASLPRFWDQLGTVFRGGAASDLTPDPYLATGTMPPLTSTFNDAGAKHRMLPAFDPTLCTGCSDCWTGCPDSAIGVTALQPAALLDAGIDRTGADAVRQVAGKIAARIISSCKTAESPPSNFGQMLDESYAWLKDKMPLPDERKQAISDGLASIVAEYGDLPVAVTPPFFDAAEAQKKDSAELLSLVINPDACKACGICIASCEPGALTAGERDADSLRRSHALWSTWSETPDTLAATLERAATTDDVGATAAILLSRYCQFALAGGDSAEPGSGEKLAVRLLLSTTEFYQQPLVQRFSKTLLDAGDALTALIKETLSSTLAVDDLDAVTEQLQRTTSPRVDLQTLAEGAGVASSEHSVDSRYLLRLIDLSTEIASAHKQLVQGPQGLGRARYGIAVAGGTTATWAGTFPHNPFQAPVVIDMSGDATQLAAGLVEGHLEETLALVRLLRLARLEIEQPDGIDWEREAVERLRWTDLSDEETELCPPMLLIGSDEMLAGRGLSQLIRLLNSDLPVKVLVLHSLDFGAGGHRAGSSDLATVNNPRSSLSLLALAQRNAFVAQTSIADPQHLGDSVTQALSYAGPALINVYAPSPTRHGFASEHALQQAMSAVSCRVMPLFRYDPRVAGVFGARLSLAGNPNVSELLAQDADDDRPLTPVDWAVRQQRFETGFTPLPADAVAPTALHEWLQLEPANRARKTAYVTVGSGEEEQRRAIAPAMLEMAEQCLQVWQTLQEVAGIVTPFTERLEEEIRAEVAAEHAADLAAQKQDADTRIAAIQEKIEAEIASKIRSRLLDLASRNRGSRK